MSHFIESVDDLIASDFGFDALRELRDTNACSVNDWNAAEKILSQVIHASIAHARKQVEGRNTGTMTFDEAMRFAANGTMVTRPVWGILNTVRGVEREVLFWKLDNCDGDGGGDGWPYNPTAEDRAATDWMFYQAPQENWVELSFR